MRKAMYRLFVLLTLLASPVLYPVLLVVLRVLDGHWARGGLRELYGFAWTQFKRGYP